MTYLVLYDTCNYSEPRRAILYRYAGDFEPRFELDLTSEAAVYMQVMTSIATHIPQNISSMSLFSPLANICNTY